MEKFLEYLAEAQKKLELASHMTYVTYPLIKEKRLLLKILTELNLSILNNINSILQYEYLYKEIELTNNAKTNFNIFIRKCAPKYKITEHDVKKIIELFNLVEKHKNSPFEFVKNDKVVIMSDNLKTDTISLEKIKEFLYIAENILKKTQEMIKKPKY